jgi:hypothetical protein
MASTFRKNGRRIALALALLLVAGWWLPSFFSAEHFRRRLEAGLERALHRPVSFGATSFRLLPRPGFSIENAVVGEDPAFGSEPFARVDRIECDLRWRSLWRSRLDFSSLRLKHASFNFARHAQGEWSVENMFRQSGVTSTPLGPVANAAPSAGELVIEADDAHINFIVGANKKPFAITGLRARLEFDPARRLLRYRLAGNPIRTDLSLPSPGVLELEGDWSPGKDLAGPLHATLRSSRTLFYDWVPIATGLNPGIYGVLDAEVHLAGSARLILVDGQCRLSQLHRWGQIPPSNPGDVALYFRGEFDRRRGRALLESVDASFADSRLHFTGSVDKIPDAPELDLVVALERSRLEDLLALSRCFGVKPGPFGVSGRVDGLLAVQGHWARRRYGGFVSARDVRLSTIRGTFPVSQVAVRIDQSGARLAPARITLSPHVELVVEGSLDRHGARHPMSRGSASPSYDLVLSARAIPLPDLVRFARAIGLRAAQNLDAQGVGTATFHLAGLAWPLTRPQLTGQGELRAGRLLVPGLTEPLNLPGAHLEVKGDEIIADRIVAVIGTSVFSGRLEHRGDRNQPWEFNLRANTLSLEQGALWFDVLGLRRPASLLDRLPGLSSFAARRTAASNLFGALNVAGRFSAGAVTYRTLTLRDFQASVEISARVIRLTKATFKAGGGRGRGQAQVNLTGAPALVTADVALAGASLQSLAPRLPPALRRLRGTYSGTGHFEARGLSREEMSASLRGQAAVRLRNIYLGDFDPIAAIAHKTGWGSLEPARGEAVLRKVSAALRVRDRHVFLENSRVDLAGAKLLLGGGYGFDGTLDLDVAADFRNLRRRWVSIDAESSSVTPLGSLHLAGPLNQLAVVPETQVSRAIR